MTRKQLIILILILVAYGVVFYFAQISSIKENEEEKNAIQAKYDECINEAKIYVEYKDAVAKIASEPYDAESNNCYDHSKSLQQELHKIGIESTIIINTERSHAWVCPWIEATTGSFITPGRYSPMEFRDSDLNVIN